MDSEPTPQPAKSAKDAINAMYAAGAKKTGLSDYLASSAKEIINSTPSAKKRDDKSAASLHRHDNRRESVRPSASTLLRQAAPKSPQKPKPIASSVDPLTSKAEIAVARSVANRAKTSSTSPTAAVVRTSLKLGPKKPPLISRAPASSLNSARRPAGDTLRAKKQSPAIKPIPRATHTENPRVFQDVIRPRPQDIVPPKARAEKPAPKDAKARLAPATPKSNRPLDSIKNRFRPAPKGYATNDPRRQRPYKAEDFLNPSHSMPADAPSTEQPDRATHIYGMIEAPREYSELPRWAKKTNDLDAATAAAQASSDSQLGVVEDYGDPIAHKSDQPDHPDHPDNNRYALSSQSPFFLQNAEVDKRPLSGGPSTREPAGTSVYAGQKLIDRPKHNRYEKKPKPAKKPKTSTPQSSSRDDLTVIIPSAHRSHIPLFFLLLITILLGVAVGALAYLFFFQ